MKNCGRRASPKLRIVSFDLLKPPFSPFPFSRGYALHSILGASIFLYISGRLQPDELKDVLFLEVIRLTLTSYWRPIWSIPELSSISSMEERSLEALSTGMSRILKGYYDLGVESLNMSLLSGQLDRRLDYCALNLRIFFILYLVFLATETSSILCIAANTGKQGRTSSSGPAPQRRS